LPARTIVGCHDLERIGESPDAHSNHIGRRMAILEAIVERTGKIGSANAEATLWLAAATAADLVLTMDCAWL
jgi:hypothetical protein